MTVWSEEPLVFECAGERLVGILHRGCDLGGRPGVLIVVGGPQYRVGSHRQFVLMARALAAAGYPVFRFDYRGMGDSTGGPRTFESVEDDIRAAILAFEQAESRLKGIVLFGLCDAASAIMMTAATESVCGKVIVNPWVRTETTEARAYVRHYYLQRLFRRDFWRKLGAGTLDIRTSSRQFIASLTRAIAARENTRATETSYIDRMLQESRNFRGRTLLLLSGRDLTAREFEALRDGDPAWSQALVPPKVECVRLDEADHTFSERRMLEAGTNATLQWIRDFESATA